MIKKRMLVLCPFPQKVAAGQRLKYEQYFERWRANGWEIDVSSFMDKKMWSIVYQKGHFISKIMGVLRGHLRRLYDLYRIPSYDLIYIFMYVTPLLTSTTERLARAQAKRLIYDIEDNIHVQQNSYSQINPNPIVKFLKWPGKVKYLIRAADHVITSSPFLNIDCKRITTTGYCSYVTSSLDIERYKPKSEYSNDNKVIIGWTGTHSSKEYLDQLSNVFLRLAERVSFKLRVIGNFKYDLPGIDLEVVEWSIDREISDLQSFDIGVYPLPLDNWVHGKSGLKAIQYMAIGLPCVATEVGTTPMLITDNVNGKLVKTEDEWVDALEKLVREPESRRRIGEQARRDAVSNYSLDTIGDIYDKILESVMNRVK